MKNKKNLTGMDLDEKREYFTFLPRENIIC